MESIGISLDELTDKLWNVWRLWTEQAHASGDLSPEQYWILRTVSRTPNIGVSQLATLRGVTPAAMTAATRRMETQGWLRRARPPHNQRVVLVSPTPKGAALLERLRAERRAWLTRLLMDLSPTERQAAVSLATKVLNRLEADGNRLKDPGQESPSP
jgi:DNA-binding MarR family transcriptional regulator